MKRPTSVAITILLVLFGHPIFAQYFGPIETALTSLSINANPRSGGIADIGVVSSNFYSDRSTTDNPGIFFNGDQKVTTNLSFLPLQSPFINDIYFLQFGAAYSINKKNIISIGTKYFSLGNVTFTDIVGNVTGESKPYEFIQDVRITHAFSDYWSAGITAKYFISNLREGLYIQGSESKPVNSFAVDLGVEYENKSSLNKDLDLNYSLGAAIMNFGPRVRYGGPGSQKEFISTQFQFGFLLGPQFKLSSISNLNIDFAYQLEKQLVPSTPIYLWDYNGPVLDDNGNLIIESGKDPDISPFRALYQSFYDAPEGTKEIDEFVHRTGLEVRWTKNDTYFLAFRLGNIYGHSKTEKVRLTTMGIGFGVAWFSINCRSIIGDSPYIHYRNSIGIGIRI